MFTRDEIDLMILGTLVLIVIMLLAIFEVLIEQVETRVSNYAVVRFRRPFPYEESRYSKEEAHMGGSREQGA